MMDRSGGVTTEGGSPNDGSIRRSPPTSAPPGSRGSRSILQLLSPRTSAPLGSRHPPSSPPGSSPSPVPAATSCPTLATDGPAPASLPLLGCCARRTCAGALPGGCRRLRSPPLTDPAIVGSSLPAPPRRQSRRPQHARRPWPTARYTRPRSWLPLHAAHLVPLRGEISLHPPSSAWLPRRKAATPSQASKSVATVAWRGPRSSTCPTASCRFTTCSLPPTGNPPPGTHAVALHLRARQKLPAVRTPGQGELPSLPPRPPMSSRRSGLHARSRSAVGDLDEDDWFAHVFNEKSWHFFQADDKVDLATTIAAGRDKFQSSVH